MIVASNNMCHTVCKGCKPSEVCDTFYFFDTGDSINSFCAINYKIWTKNECACVAFSFCWFTINSVDFSLEQNISRLFRQAFIHYCELHQVWEQPSITAIIYVTRTLWVHALNLEHAQSVLCIFAGAQWMDWFGHDHYVVCAHGFVKILF